MYMFSDNSYYGIIILIIIIILYLIIIYKLFQNPPGEQMINIKPIENPTWDRNKCIYTLGETLEEVLEQYNIKKTNNGNATMRVPCTYDEINKEINEMNPKRDQRIFIIHDADHIAAKDYLWKLMVQHFGVAQASKLMPNTYIMYSGSDMERFKKDYKPGKLYIMKKNIQRQEGLKITDSYDEIINSRKEYVVVQELLQDPYTISGRKINMRLYVLVICQDDNIDIYVYNNGFMYYTKDLFKAGSRDFGPNITTGYIDRQVYQENPLTLQDFRSYLDNTQRQLSVSEKQVKQQGLKLSDVVFSRIYKLLHKVFLSAVGSICTGNKLKSAITFQLFGADIALNNELQPTIMEINKGPDMGAKDERDAEVKKGCTRDMLRILGLININGPNGFIKILDKEGDQFNHIAL